MSSYPRGKLVVNVKAIFQIDTYSIPLRLLQVTITKYEGARAADGLLEGTGYAEFTSGNKYNGDFQQGHMHGRGEYVWVDGLVYTGDFVKNKITGTGVGSST